MTIKALFPTVRPTLNLDFAKTKALDPRITFTRASTGTFVGVDGLIQTAATDVSRFDHNPTTGESLGLLVEEARTNLLLNSATLSTQSATVTAVPTTLSFYGTGTVTLTGVSTAGPLVGTGASNRVSLTFTPTAGSLTLTVSGSVTNAQLEAGAFPTSYIPTVASTATRAADVASITGTNFSSWYNNTEGTFVTDAILAFTQDAGNPFTFGGVFYTTVVDAVRTLGNATIMSGLSNSLTSFSKTAVALKSGNFAIGRGGNITASSSTVYTPTGTQWAINSSLGSLAVIKRLAYYPVRLPNAQLQALTAT